MGLTVLGLTAWVFLARASGGSGTGDSSGGSGTDDPLAGLTSGECFNLSAPEFALIPCQQPHEDEAYYRYALPRGAFPGDLRVRNTAISACDAHLAGYVDSTSVAEFFDWPITPDRSEWAAGDRVAVCVLTRLDMKQITGSAHQAH